MNQRCLSIAGMGLTSALLLCSSFSAMEASAAPAPQQPNILLVISDDLNNWIAPMKGHPQAKTPSLDRLASRGVTFMNAQSPAPLCNPSRTAFMSGKRPTTTGIYDNQQTWMPHIEKGLCINDYLRHHGFKSLGAGKIYHYRNYRPEEWDEVFYAHDDTLPRSVAERSPGPHGYRMFTDGPPQAKFQEKRAEDKLVDAQSVSWCIEQLKSTTNRFFMACGIHRPHTPWDVPKKYFDLYPLETLQLPTVLSNDLADVPSAGVRFANPEGVHAKIVQAGLWLDRVRGYLGAVSYMDAQVGRLLEALEKSPHKDNTIIVFVGDNGWHLGQKEHWGKVTAWADGARVPMIWVAPGVTKSGTQCDQGVDLMSIYPTLCELAGVPLPKHLDGISIKPLLADPSADWKQPGLCTVNRGNHVLVNSQWRYIRYADGSEELYDHRADPYEWTNVVTKAEHQSVKSALAKYFPAKEAAPVQHQPEGPAKKKKKKGKAAVQSGSEK